MFRLRHGLLQLTPEAVRVVDVETVRDSRRWPGTSRIADLSVNAIGSFRSKLGGLVAAAHSFAPCALRSSTIASLPVARALPPAMAAGNTDRLWSIVAPISARAPKPGRRVPYKRFVAQAAKTDVTLVG